MLGSQVPESINISPNLTGFVANLSRLEPLTGSLGLAGYNKIENLAYAKSKTLHLNNAVKTLVSVLSQKMTIVN